MLELERSFNVFLMKAREALAAAPITARHRVLCAIPGGAALPDCRCVTPMPRRLGFEGTMANPRSLFDILEEKVDPNLLNAAYRAYAKAMAEAQALEGMLSLFLLEASFEQSSHGDIEDFARITGFNVDKRTLGRLVKSMKRDIRPLPKDFRKHLEQALEIRNFLAHEFFIRTHTKFLYEKWLRGVVLELETMRRSLKEVNDQLQQLAEARPRPKAGSALKPVERRVSETVLNLVRLIALAEELKHDSETVINT